MTPDWRALTPHRPLEPTDDRYVPPPSPSAEAAADWIAAGGSNTVLLGGPVGVGKSTVLARAATLLRDRRVACLIALDRAANMRHISADEARALITKVVADVALRVLELDLSDGLREVLFSRGMAPKDAIRIYSGGQVFMSPSDLLDLTLREVARKSRQGRVCLLIDGMEKSPQSVGQHVFEALARLEDQVDLVAVIPWHAAFGPGAETVLRPGERLVSVRAPVVSPGPEGEAGRQFLRRILELRLGLPAGRFDADAARTPDTSSGESPPADVPLLVETAAMYSGGIPRVFLQILADAATYARLRRSAAWPGPVDVEDALADQRDSLRRILLPGDKARIRAADGTDGTELDLDAKIRLMAHGILLERSGPAGPVLHPHPLVSGLLGGNDHA